MEVTTLRRDVPTDGRRATVAFTDDWREDAARRDFTFNALSANPVTGEIFDYFGGLEDLRRHHVRFIGSPLERIAEDHLRILRFFGFHARFGEGLPVARKSVGSGKSVQVRVNLGGRSIITNKKSFTYTNTEISE